MILRNMNFIGVWMKRIMDHKKLALDCLKWSENRSTNSSEEYLCAAQVHALLYLAEILEGLITDKKGGS